jgi:[protein-PII] uridylyltransferase
MSGEGASAKAASRLEATREAVVASAREALEGARRRWAETHRSESAVAACERLSDFHDALIVSFLERAGARSGRDFKGLAVAALGGFGRRELSPRSDIDLLFLVGERGAGVEAIVRETLHPLFDIGLDVGYAARTVEEALAVIGSDLESATAMLESRLLAGDAALFEDFHRRFGEALRGPGRGWFFRARLEAWRRRREKYDDSVYLLEPHLKEGSGGLRDGDCVRWLLDASERTTDFGALTRLGICAEDEVKRLLEARDFILRVRNELHSLWPRKSDLLNHQAQAAIAPRLGFEPVERTTAAEALMHAYYRRARDVARIAGRAFRALLRRESDEAGPILPPRPAEKIDGLTIGEDGFVDLEPDRAARLEAEPETMPALFAQARRSGLRVGEATRALIERIVKEAGGGLSENPVASRHFLDLLGEARGLARTLEDMHDCGLLTAILPEFERVHCMVRIDHYHRYTVDEHLIHAVGNVERLLDDPPESCKRAAEVARRIERLDLLHLALLLHDVGKGYGKGHALLGAQLIQRIGRRLGLEKEDVETARFLVLSHLKLSHAARRRDLEDPHVAQELAGEVRTAERLDMLYVHTVCDQMAVSPEALTDWRARLFETCHRVTARALAGVGAVAPRKAPDVEAIGRRALEFLGEGSVEATRGGLADFLAEAPDRYLRATPPEFIAEHYRLSRKLDERERVEWSVKPGQGASELIVCSADAPGTFAMTCGALAARRINIRSAQIYSTSGGLAINRFQVTDSREKPLSPELRLKRLRSDLNRVFLGELTMEELMARHDRRAHRAGPPVFVWPTEVKLDNDSSREFTILEVTAVDRPGLLYRIARTLDAEKLNLHLALVTTESYRVVDVFYLTDLEANKIDDIPRVERLRRALIEALDQSEAAGRNR